MRLPSIAIAVAALLQAAALGVFATKFSDRAQQPCAGSLEPSRDERSADDLAQLPVVARPIERARTVRSSGLFGGTETTVDAEYQLGDYRLAWSMESDRGRPGICRVVIDRPDLCDGKPIAVEYNRFDGAFSSPLRRDLANGTNVIVFTEALQPPGQIALVFRLNSDRSRHQHRIAGGAICGVGCIALCAAVVQRVRRDSETNWRFFAALTLSVVCAALSIAITFRG